MCTSAARRSEGERGLSGEKKTDPYGVGVATSRAREPDPGHRQRQRGPAREEGGAGRGARDMREPGSWPRRDASARVTGRQRGPVGRRSAGKDGAGEEREGLDRSWGACATQPGETLWGRDCAQPPHETTRPPPILREEGDGFTPCPRPQRSRDAAPPHAS